jgi:hypothetical protein
VGKALWSAYYPKNTRELLISRKKNSQSVFLRVFRLAETAWSLEFGLIITTLINI